MIKEFKNITDKDLAYMQTHKVTVTEKLDMIFFELLPLTLEEIFISETEVIGYDIKNFILN